MKNEDSGRVIATEGGGAAGLTAACILPKSSDNLRANMDHFILTAVEAASAIVKGPTGTSAIRVVNIEEEYHETDN